MRAWSAAPSFRMGGPYRIEFGDLAKLEIGRRMGELSLRPGATKVWRLRATSASPSITPLAHPKGTTDEILIDVVA